MSRKRWHQQLETIECWQSVELLTAGAWLDLDLLRRRREELGLQELSTLPVTQLLVRGSVVGGSLVMLALLVLLVLFVQWRLMLGERRQLTPIAQAFDAEILRLQETRTAVETTTGINQQMVDAVAGIRSSTALLTELQRLIPNAARYELITARGNRLELKGDVREPKAVETLNRFQLMLDSSSFFERDGVVLERADASGAQEDISLKFQFIGEFAADAVEATRPRLVELEAIGLAKRLMRLREEGLLK